MKKEAAVVLLSGGQDSVTALWWAKREFESVTAISFQYAQRHKIEIECARRIACLAGVPHQIFDVLSIAQIGGSALTSQDQPIVERDGQLPTSFVPGRNIIFLALAGGWAKMNNVQNVVIGVNAVDFSGYPDCRGSFIQVMEETLREGLDAPISICTPLIHKSKADIWALAEELGILDIIIHKTHTCYEGVRISHAWGYGCGTCPACRLRQAGYETFKKQV